MDHPDHAEVMAEKNRRGKEGKEKNWEKEEVKKTK
jgi:hypothetical protein